jgi:hypothetical protein
MKYGDYFGRKLFFAVPHVRISPERSTLYSNYAYEVTKWLVID